LKEDWQAWNEVNGTSKEAFRTYLSDNALSSTDNVVAVDFGYKGSAHSVVSEYFSGKFIPLFFMTYNGEMGNDPYPDAQAYLFSNMNVRFKTCTPLISHNLIIETLINEPLGSLSAYKLVDGTVELEREELDSDTHKTKIRAIHNGVLNFSDLWIKKIENLSYPVKLESNSSTYLLSMFLSRPQANELDILKGLIFDNAFAGAENSYILSPHGVNEKDIWKEGIALIKKNAKPVSSIATAASNVKNITSAIVKAATPTPKPASPAPKAAASKPAAKAPAQPSNQAKVAAQPANKVTAPVQPRPAPAPVAFVYNGQRTYKAVKSLHRNQFLHALSSIAFPDQKLPVEAALVNLVPSKGKNYVAIQFLKDNGGLWKSKLSLMDKLYLATSNLGIK